MKFPSWFTLVRVAKNYLVNNGDVGAKRSNRPIQSILEKKEMDPLIDIEGLKGLSTRGKALSMELSIVISKKMIHRTLRSTVTDSHCIFLA